jgi:glycosyltransferase involved in cell wall biosynthesis
VQAFHVLSEVPEHEPRAVSHWLQVLSHVDPKYGGIASSVPRLAWATETHGAQRCGVVAFCAKEELHHIHAWERAPIGDFEPKRLRSLIDYRFRHRVAELIRNANGLHIHGIWEMHSMMATGIARNCRRPYIVSAHGMLEPWALNHKRLKKAFYAAMIETRNLRGAACLRALSAAEVDDYRRLGLTNKIAIVPNGIETPPAGVPERFWLRHPELRDRKVVLFLGRLHPKKGLPMLLEAWSRVQPSDPDAHLLIAGPDSEGEKANLEGIAAQLGLRGSVSFPGMITGQDKWDAMAAAKLFVLPSYSEGFSMAVLEALAMGLPVIVTEPCHIPEVAAHGCGWVIEPSADSIERALRESIELASRELQQMGERGKALLRQRFHLSVVGKQMAQVYEWIDGGATPSGVEVV